jgi:hypothetical protein
VRRSSSWTSPTAVLVPQEVDELFGQPAPAHRRGPHDHLHLATKLRRGAVGRRRHHRDPPRHHGRLGRPERSPPASWPR